MGRFASRGSAGTGKLTGSRLKDRYVRDRRGVLLSDENGAVEGIHDRHLMGLFPRTVWLELIASAGFEPLVVPFEHSSYSKTPHEVFLGLRPVADGGV